MKKYIKSTNLIENPISLILIVDNVNIPTPTTIFASDNPKHRQYIEDELQEMFDNGEISKLRGILDFNNLVKMFHMNEDTKEYIDFNYTFTQKQKDILSEGFEHYADDTVNVDMEIPKLLKFIKDCDYCTIPFPRKTSEEAYKNFAKYNHLRLAPEDYLAIIRKFESADYQGCVRSYYPDYFGDKIFRFRRIDEYFNSVGESVGKHNLWMEINLRQSYDNDIVALISLHDAETSEHLE